jgi:hypothetical protein
MIERVDAGVAHVRIGLQIGRRVEELVRVATLVPAEGIVVRDRIDAGLQDVGVLRDVEQRIDERIAVAVVDRAIVRPGEEDVVIRCRNRGLVCEASVTEETMNSVPTPFALPSNRRALMS